MNKLAWYELIPVVSFIVLVGRCRSCQTKISLQYPIIELISGILFAAIFLKFRDTFFISPLDFSVVYIYTALFFSTLLVISTYDIKHKIIPDALSLLLGVVSFFGLFFIGSHGSFVQVSYNPYIPSLLDIMAGPIVALPFALIWLISRGKWMGLGDAKLMLGIGWFLGLSGAFSGAIFAFWSGAIIGVLLMIVSKKYKMKTEIPFAPYLVLGTLIVFFFNVRFLGGL